VREDIARRPAGAHAVVSLLGERDEPQLAGIGAVVAVKHLADEPDAHKRTSPARTWRTPSMGPERLKAQLLTLIATGPRHLLVSLLLANYVRCKHDSTSR
jgi:hypothetical protein